MEVRGNDIRIFRTTSMWMSVRWTVAAVLATLLGTMDAKSADDDLQFWFPVQIIHPVNDRLSLSMQTELRLKDDISEFSQLVYKPAVHYHPDSCWVMSAGYKYIDKYEEANEQDPWQEITLNRQCHDLVTGYQVRIEERVIDDIDGVLPRLRLLTHASHPLGESPHYLTAFGALRFNLDDKGEGPVSGFEQSRIYAGLGHHFGNHVQFEVGYLWRYEEKRAGEDRSDHAIHFRLVFNTKEKRVRKPHPRDQYR
jgi:hypothetical protein